MLQRCDFQAPDGAADSLFLIVAKSGKSLKPRTFPVSVQRERNGSAGEASGEYGGGLMLCRCGNVEER